MIHLIVLSYLLVLFQVGFWSHFPVNGAWPNLALLFILLFSLRSNDSFKTWLLAIWTGFLLDVLYYGQAGAGMLAMIMLVSLVQIGQYYFSLKHWPSYFICLIVLSVCYEPLRLLIIAFEQSSFIFDPRLLTTQLLYHCILMVGFWLLLPNRFKQRFLT